MARERKDLATTMEHQLMQHQSIGRFERLSESVARIRGGRRMDPDRVQLAVGAILAIVGIIAIFLGWYAAARTPYLFEQIPYLISGGLLGLALTFLGGFVYFSYWITRVVRDSRTQSDRATQLLDRIAETLDGATVSNGSKSSSTTARSGTFVATRNGTQFHRPDCPTVAGKRGLRTVTSRTRGLKPCAICDPQAE